ncbi:MAG: zf-HC2 domain-containing protein, partial [Bacillota bacterium]
MRCRMVKTLLPLHIAGALRPEVAEQLDEHLAGCAACRMIAAEMKVNQPETKLPPAPPTPPTPSPQISQPLAAYRQHASLAKAAAETASTAASDAVPEHRTPVEPSHNTSGSARADRPASPPPLNRERAPSLRGGQKRDHKDATDHPGWRLARSPRVEAVGQRSPRVVAQTLFTALMVVLAMVMGMAWRGSSLRLDAYQNQVAAGAVAELQANLQMVKDQLRSPEKLIALPALSKETLAMSLLLKADTTYQADYLSLIDAYGQMQSAIALWRGEQGSAPAAIISNFATAASQAADGVIQALEPLKGQWPPTAEQRTAIKQAASHLQGLALSYVDEGIVPGQLPEAKVGQQAAIQAAAALLPTGAEPIKPAAVRRYQRRQGTDLWEVSFTHNLQKWQVGVSAETGQVMGMTLPVPSKGEQVAPEQVEQIALSYLAERASADRFILTGRQEKEGQVLYTAYRVIDGL